MVVMPDFPSIVAFHTLAAVCAAALGASIVASKKGTNRHRLLGRIFIVLMISVAISSFFILERNHGHFSAIHILSIVVLITAPLTYFYARTGRIRRHKLSILSLYFSLLVAGGFALAPDRMLARFLFN